MAVTEHEYITVEGDYITAYLLVWRRYRTFAPGILENMLDINPHLALIHRSGPFLPIGTKIKMPIDHEILKNSPKPRTRTVLWGRG